MALTLTVVLAVVLTIAVIILSRSGAVDHQEDLNTHPEPGDDRVTTSPDDPAPKADRPAGPEAEAMGADVGEPTLRQERR